MKDTYYRNLIFKGAPTEEHLYRDDCGDIITLIAEKEWWEKCTYCHKCNSYVFKHSYNTRENMCVFCYKDINTYNI